MRRIIKYSIIKEINEYLKMQITSLRQEQQKLLLDISKINGCYQGKDANLIISKYTLKANQLSVYITNVENYVKYFDWLCNNYHISQRKAMSNLSSLISQKGYDRLLKTTFDLNNISYIGSGDNNEY